MDENVGLYGMSMLLCMKKSYQVGLKQNDEEIKTKQGALTGKKRDKEGKRYLAILRIKRNENCFDVVW